MEGGAVVATGRAVQEYASELQQLWPDLYYYDPLHLNHAACDVRDMARLECRWFIHLLNVLNTEFKPWRAVMFCQLTLPTMEQAVSAMV